MSQLLIQGEEFLGKAFDDTTTSYKFLFFKSLLDVVDARKNSNLIKDNSISLKKLSYLCIVNAWYPINTFKLSFGKADQIQAHIERLKTKFPNTKEFKKNKLDNQKFLLEIENLSFSDEVKEIYNNLKKYVPYRFLVPWLSKELRGIPDNDKHKKILLLSEKDRKLPADNQILPYHFIEKDKELSIEISERFIHLAQTHSLLIYDWWKWNFANYLQKHNPLVPGILYKLEQPEERDLRIARTYWDTILTLQPQKRLHCIYSHELIANTYDIDHFIPWSFIAHDQLWNLIPVSQSANRSKSDILPDLNEYLSPFIDFQVSALELFADKYLLHDSRTHSLVEKAEAGFAFSDRENLFLKDDYQNRNSISEMKNMLESNIRISYSLAAKCGFPSGWKYSQALVG